jgi:hypothetical protein
MYEIFAPKYERHPHVPYGYVVLGWVRVCAQDERVWIIEEIQTDIQYFRKPKFIDTELTSWVSPERIDFLKKIAKNIYANLLGMVISLGYQQGKMVFMVTTEVKRANTPEAPETVYSQVPKKMGMVISTVPSKPLWYADMFVWRHKDQEAPTQATSNPPPQSWGRNAVVLDLGGKGQQPLHGGAHWDERVKQRVQQASLAVRLQLYELYQKVRSRLNKEFFVSDRVNIQWDGAPGRKGNYLVVQYDKGEPFMVTVLISQNLESIALGRSKTVQADAFFIEPLSFKVDHTDVEKRTVAPQSPPGTALRPESRKQRENREMAERLLGRTK